jgi:ABC-type branched-subunit amino acid transport system ATPase component
MSDTTALLLIDAIAHRFRGLQVLKDVSFSVAKGSITGLIGPNGAGKSTLFNIISGFLRPMTGQIIYMERSITKLSIQQRSRIGLVRTFQTPQVFRNLTVRENVIAGCYKQGRTGVVESLIKLPKVGEELARAMQIADELCSDFGLGPVRNHVAGRLPAGQQRLLELARASASTPALLCLDEPSSGLSSDEVAQLMVILRALNARGISILLVSHDMELMAISSTIHVLCFGEIIASGRLAELQVDRRVREAYLGVE